MIYLKTKKDIKFMKEAAKILVEAMFKISQTINVGISTKRLDSIAKSTIEHFNAKPAFLGYPGGDNGFPASVCTSINEEVVHGIPKNNRMLQEGDIMSIDIGVEYKGYFSDAAYTFKLGNIDREVEKLLKVTEEALYLGIDKFQITNRLFDISYAIQQHVEKNGFSVVRDFVGHGIGKKLHEEPQIPNFGNPGTGIRLKTGMVFAIEPMVNMGSYEVEILNDGWTVVTKDRKPSAHFEHTVALTENGPEILTRFDF